MLNLIIPFSPNFRANNWRVRALHVSNLVYTMETYLLPKECGIVDGDEVQVVVDLVIFLVW